MNTLKTLHELEDKTEKEKEEDTTVPIKKKDESVEEDTAEEVEGKTGENLSDLDYSKLEGDELELKKSASNLDSIQVKQPMDLIVKLRENKDMKKELIQAIGKYRTTTKRFNDAFTQYKDILSKIKRPAVQNATLAASTETMKNSLKDKTNALRTETVEIVEKIEKIYKELGVKYDKHITNATHEIETVEDEDWVELDDIEKIKIRLAATTNPEHKEYCLGLHHYVTYTFQDLKEIENNGWDIQSSDLDKINAFVWIVSKRLRDSEEMKEKLIRAYNKAENEGKFDELMEWFEQIGLIKRHKFKQWLDERETE